MLLTWKQRLAVVAGNAMEFYDIAVFAAIAPFLTQIMENHGYENATTLIWGMFALRFLLRPLGGYIVGNIADYYGKKNALIMTSSLTGFATLTMAALPTELEYVVFYFLFLQIIQAFSFGGEYPTVINYLTNHSPKKEVARTSCLIVASSIVGVLLSIAIVETLKFTLSSEAMQSYGWRIPLLIGGVNIAVSFWFRSKLPKEVNTVVEKTKQSPRQWIPLFFISMGGAVVFYIQNLSSTILQKSVDIPHFSLINSSLLLACILLSGYLTDKITTPKHAFRTSSLAGALLYFPTYWLLTHAITEVAIVGMLIISIISAIILANLAVVRAQIAKNQTVVLGLCYNIALSIFGGLTPLVVAMTTEYDASFVGLYAALCVIPALLSVHYSLTPPAQPHPPTLQQH